MAITHFALGAAMTTILVTAVAPTVRYPRMLLLAGGGWAMLPDLYWVSPVFQQQLRAVHQTAPWVDIFWFHRTLDRVDPADSKMVAAVTLAVLVGATAVAEYRNYRATDVVGSTHNLSP